MVKQKTIISVLGPTAVGKTAMSIELAKRFNTEIISCDSRQFYKEMSIGTAKPDDHELAQAKHHFISSHSIHEPFNAGDFEREGLQKVEELFNDHDVLILIGGSGLFEKALIEGFDDFPKVDEEVKLQTEKLLEEDGLESLVNILQKKDPETLDSIDRNNPQRVLRAVQIILSGGMPLSHWKNKKEKNRNFQTIRIGLNMDRELLYSRINKRVDIMMQNGLLKEVEALVSHKQLNSLKTVGYTELFEYLEGNCTLEEAVALIKQNSRRYAKRQITWFKKYADIKWFQPDELEQIDNYIKAKL